MNFVRRQQCHSLFTPRCRAPWSLRSTTIENQNLDSENSDNITNGPQNQTNRVSRTHVLDWSLRALTARECLFRLIQLTSLRYETHGGLLNNSDRPDGQLIAWRQIRRVRRANDKLIHACTGMNSHCQIVEKSISSFSDKSLIVTNSESTIEPNLLFPSLAAFESSWYNEQNLRTWYNRSG